MSIIVGTIDQEPHVDTLGLCTRVVVICRFEYKYL